MSINHIKIRRASLMDDYEDGELFNDDFDDTQTVIGGVQGRRCGKCQSRNLDFRVEGRFVVRTCLDCGHENED